MASQLKAVVGLNIVTDTGEVRYEPGDVVKVAHVEEWMVDEGVVSDGKVRAPKPPPAPVDVVVPDGDALLDHPLTEDELADQAKALDALDAESEA